jgi:hypothetical protein
MVDQEFTRQDRVKSVAFEARALEVLGSPYSDQIVGSKILFALSGPRGLRASGFASG